MAAAHQGPDRTSEEKVAEPDNMKEQPLSARNESSAPPSSAQDAATIGNSRDTTNQSGSFSSGGDHSVYPPNIYAPQAQAFYYRGFENPTGEWDEYPQFINAEGLEIGSSGIYNDNPSLMFHTGFGYSPQMPYGPYSPVTTPLPSVGGDGQLYSPQQFQFSGTPYYQQLVSPSMPYITSPTPVSQPELTTLVSEHQQHDGMLFGPRPCYPPPLGSFDWSKPADRQRSFTPLSPAVSPQPTGTLGSFGSVGMASQQQRTLFGFGSGSNSYNRGYIPGGFNQGSSFGSASISSLGANGRGWFTFDNNKRRGRPSGALCSCNGTLDVLSEQNRGPRATKPKNQNTGEHSPPMETSKNSISNAKNQDDLYNRADFLTEYEDAKFFIIKSYSEDNVHKSIKYGVWASTPNGNRKLDAAYREAMEKQGTCPIFLFFSVNASAQFCGVAEMVGPVDFDKSVDYWQQDKWSGQFPVKWHIIKDVPNSQFRHIVLENNDKKPVTNSRDTQEVKLEQGIEMLNIFKNYETDVSILDDFDFYEERQKAMQERKARQQAGFMTGGGNECKNNGLSSDLMKQMSKSFAQAVRLEECSKEGTAPDRGSSASDGSVGTPTTTAPTS
ncbi:YTH domain-containing protein ECT2 isoform X3 [Malania oleifera]|uniref:YTH domain-containing protein ECT2 isoform X3 n=1 Tax=Malania oleifera TaxID=397392 RepID=UPI0025AE1001|nr:YTH domain-containing protein ECT2 isoform X3 [Malania oleifera]